MKNTTKKFNISKIILTIIFWAIGITMLVPLIWMISTACKVEADVFNFPIEWIPRRWNLVQNMKEVWGGRYNFGLYYLNSIKVAVLATFFQVFVSALGAYGFSKIKFKGRDALFLAYLATMMIPPQVTIVSQFIITRQLGLYNTHAGLIAMLAFSVYGVFLLRQAMMAVPDSLSESAQIDGAGHLRIFFQIILPMVKPSLATLATIGAAPVPVPPPIPVVINTMSEPRMILEMSSIFSSAACFPTSGLEPAPCPLVIFSPIAILVGALDVRRTCLSQLIVTKSTP